MNIQQVLDAPRKKAFTPIALIFLAAYLAGCSVPPADEGKRFISSDGKFSMTLPFTWETKLDFMGTAIASLSPSEGPNDNFKENVNVAVKLLPGRVSLEQKYQDALMGLSRGVEDFMELENGTTRLSGVEARWLIYSFPVENLHFQVLMYLFVKGNESFVITSTAIQEKFPQYRDTFFKIANSFRFEKPKNTVTAPK